MVKILQGMRVIEGSAFDHASPMGWAHRRDRLGSRVRTAEPETWVNLGLEGDRFKARAGITEILKPGSPPAAWTTLRARSMRAAFTWSVFRSFAQTVAEDPDCSSINFSAFNRFRLKAG